MYLKSYTHKMFQIKTNFTLCVSGPSQSGKTSFVVKLLNHSKQLFDKDFSKIYWILGDPKAIPKGLKVSVEYIIG